MVRFHPRWVNGAPPRFGTASSAGGVRRGSGPRRLRVFSHPRAYGAHSSPRAKLNEFINSNGSRAWAPSCLLSLDHLRHRCAAIVGRPPDREGSRVRHASGARLAVTTREVKMSRVSITNL